MPEFPPDSADQPDPSDQPSPGEQSNAGGKPKPGDTIEWMLLGESQTGIFESKDIEGYYLVNREDGSQTRVYPSEVVAVNPETTVEAATEVGERALAAEGIEEPIPPTQIPVPRRGSTILELVPIEQLTPKPTAEPITEPATDTPEHLSVSPTAKPEVGDVVEKLVPGPDGKSWVSQKWEIIGREMAPDDRDASTLLSLMRVGGGTGSSFANVPIEDFEAWKTKDAPFPDPSHIDLEPPPLAPETPARTPAPKPEQQPTKEFQIGDEVQVLLAAKPGESGQRLSKGWTIESIEEADPDVEHSDRRAFLKPPPGEDRLPAPIPFELLKNWKNYQEPGRTPEPAPRPQGIKYDSPKRAIWRSKGPQGQDNPEAEVVGEDTWTDGRIFYRMRDPKQPGRGWWAPADEVEIVASPPTQPENEQAPGEAEADNPPEDEETVSAPELDSAVLRKLQESISTAETKISNLEQLFEETRTKAKQAIDDSEFDTAAKLVEQAKIQRIQLRIAKGKLKFLRKKYKRAAELVNPANILDLKDKFDARLSQEKDRRARIQDHDPLDDYAEMLKSHMIELYIQTASPTIAGNITAELMKEIMANLDKSYNLLQAELARSGQPESAPETSFNVGDMVQFYLGDDEGGSNLSNGWTIESTKFGIDQDGNSGRLAVLTKDGTRLDRYVPLSQLQRAQAEPEPPVADGEPPAADDSGDASGPPPADRADSGGPGGGDRIPDGDFDSNQDGPTGGNTPPDGAGDGEKVKHRGIPGFFRKTIERLERLPTKRRRLVKFVGYVAFANEPIGAAAIIYYFKTKQKMAKEAEKLKKQRLQVVPQQSTA